MDFMIEFPLFYSLGVFNLENIINYVYFNTNFREQIMS